MRTAISHWRDEFLVDAFMVKDNRVTQNIDGSETQQLIFPHELTILSGDKINITYFPNKE